MLNGDVVTTDTNSRPKRELTARGFAGDGQTAGGGATSSRDHAVV